MDELPATKDTSIIDNSLRGLKNLKIPRKAVEPLAEACVELSQEWGKPADVIFRECLELMKKYSEFFFSQPFP